MDLEDPKQLQALASEVFHLVCERLAQEGLQPDSEVVGELFATLMASHWAFRGGTELLKWVLLEMTLHQMNKAEEMVKEHRDASSSRH